MKMFPINLKTTPAFICAGIVVYLLPMLNYDERVADFGATFNTLPQLPLHEIYTLLLFLGFGLVIDLLTSAYDYRLANREAHTDAVKASLNQLHHDLERLADRMQQSLLLIKRGDSVAIIRLEEELDQAQSDLKTLAFLENIHLESAYDQSLDLFEGTGSLGASPRAGSPGLM